VLSRRRSAGAAGRADGESVNDGDEEFVPSTAAQLRVKGIALLARREHSRGEMEKKLARHTDDASLIAQVLDQLQTEKLLSDQRFAEGVVRVRGARYGSLRVAQDLRARGIGGEMAAGLITGLKSTESERALAAWQRKFGTPAVDGSERARQMRFLQARGFTADVIRKVVPRAARNASDEDLD
jgi:regulatory protein